MQKKLLLLTALVLTSSTISAKVVAKKNNIMQRLSNAMWSYNENTTVAHRTNFDNALQQITNLTNNEWVRSFVEEGLQTAKWYDDIYMNLELVGAGGHLMPDYSKRMMSIREEKEWKATLNRKAKQYGFKDAEYEQLLNYAFVLAESNEKRDQKQINDIAQMLISKKSADKKKGLEQLKALTRSKDRRPMATPKK